MREFRQHFNKSIAEFSEECSISPRQLSNYERGKNIPSIDSLVKMSQNEEIKAEYTLEDLFRILVVEPLNK